MNKMDIIIIFLLAAVPLIAFLDWWLIGLASPMEYLLVNAVEMGMLAVGYVFGKA